MAAVSAATYQRHFKDGYRREPADSRSMSMSGHRHRTIFTGRIRQRMPAAVPSMRAFRVRGYRLYSTHSKRKNPAPKKERASGKDPSSILPPSRGEAKAPANISATEGLLSRNRCNATTVSAQPSAR